MNNRGMVFLLLGVVFAAMVIITVTRPELPVVADSGGVSRPPASVADAGTPASQPGGQPVSQGGGADLAPAALPERGPERAPESASGQTTVQQGATPPAAVTPPVAPPAAPPASSPSTAPATVADGTSAAPAGGGSGTLALRMPSGAGSGTPTPARPDQPGTTPPPSGGTRNLEMTTSPRSGTTPAMPAATTAQAGGESPRPPASQAQPQVNPNAEHSLSIMALRFAGQGMILKIQAEDAFTVKSFALPDPHRLVVDLGGNWKNMRAPMVPDNSLVKGARTGRQENAARLVLDLDRPLKKYDTVRISPSEVEIHME